MQYATEIRSRVAATLGISPGDVLISCSHTHSGPATMPLRRWGAVDEEYVRVVQKHTAGAAAMAAKNMQVARIGAGVGHVDGVAVNRREKGEGAVDPQVGVIRIDDAHGEMLAVLVNFSCHPVAAHNYQNMISADYPGYAMAVIEKAKDGRALALHTTGAAGDINPRDLHHIKYAEKYGNMVGGEALKVAESIGTGPELEIQVDSEVVHLPVSPLPSADELKQLIADAEQEVSRLQQDSPPYDRLMSAYIRLEWAQEALQAVETKSTVDHLPLEIQAVRFNDAVLVALPGEPFVEIGLNIKRSSPYPFTFIVELANGAINYLPTGRAFEQGGYELDFATKVYGLYALTPDVQDIVEAGSARVLSRV